MNDGNNAAQSWFLVCLQYFDWNKTLGFNIPFHTTGFGVRLLVLMIFTIKKVEHEENHNLVTLQNSLQTTSV